MQELNSLENQLSAETNEGSWRARLSHEGKCQETWEQ